ncbi:hypothetical protein EST38_g4244 [Candolleomyces aberdarensis]|uniref:Sensitive to high expression protein 9, mitochondrial n=1 Tax=Candolleomyces aberdarensis TaxID=2316362 RepID=A0A4Q2DNI2_9AGAR|nr:hypothetical protein EST38_g4244 [Candolleomyces aberdarensis]
MLRTSLSRPLRQLSNSSAWKRKVQYRLAHNVSTAQQQTQTTEGDKDTASVTSAGSSSSTGSTFNSPSDPLLAGGEKEDSAVPDSSSLASRSIPPPSPSSFPSDGAPKTELGHSTSTSTSTSKKDSSTTTDSSADALSTLPTYNLDEVKQRIRHWTEHAAVTIRDRADEFTAKTKTQFSQLGAHLNKATGYEEIEALKRDVVAQGEFISFSVVPRSRFSFSFISRSIAIILIRFVRTEHRINETRRAARQAKVAYEEAVIQRSKSQREVNDLLQRKSTWTDNDVSRFTTLVRQDHLYEQEEHRAKTAVDDSEEAVEKEFSQLMRLILARYHEEQVWSDKIRSASTYGQLAALGLNLLVFILAIILVEPWKRKRLAQTFERKVEELSEDYAKLLEGSMKNIDQRLLGQEKLLVELAEDLARRESSSSAWSDVVVAESGLRQVPSEQTTPSIPLPSAGVEEVVPELPKTARIAVANVELSGRTVEMLAIGTGTFVLGALTAVLFSAAR